MRSCLLTVCSRMMFLLNLVCVNTASIAVLGNVSNQKRKTRFSKACRTQKPSTPALETWTTTSLTSYTPLHAVQASTRSNHSRIYRRPAQVGRPHSHTVGHGESSQTVWYDSCRAWTIKHHQYGLSNTFLWGFRHLSVD